MPLILAPPGAGKSTWVESRKDWHDMDVLYKKVHPETWNQTERSQKEEEEHYKEIDKLLEKDRKKKKIIGSLFWKAVPDAIVIPEEDEHKKRVKKRSDLVWKTAEFVSGVLRKVSEKHKIPVFESFDAAATYASTWYK
jgi:NH3-dependent NAD+ synthetase